MLGKLFSIGIYVPPCLAMQLRCTPTWPSGARGTACVLALVFYDFCYYWLHRAGHVVALFWAAHVVHHQSQHYNLSTALRQTSSGAFFGWIFYLPMAIAGVPPMIFGIVALIDLLYQFWVHTEQVGKLGWFDRVFCSPSNHRVHHAVNDTYIDKNYGGILVLWDRWFGTFTEEKEACVYGTRGPLNSWDPLWANAEVYWGLAKDSWATRRWRDKLRVWFKPPGWQPADLAAAHPKPAFTLAQVQTYNPPLSRGQQRFAGLQFVLLLGAVAGYLWVADSLSFAHAAVGCVALSACVWALGRYLQGGLHALEVLAVEAAALATLGAMELLPYYLPTKPLVMVIAMIFVAGCAYSTGANGTYGTKSRALLLGALLFSLGGDVFLMLPGDYFIPGLASFLVAHVFYIALFRQGAGWFVQRKALWGLLAFWCTDVRGVVGQPGRPGAQGCRGRLRHGDLPDGGAGLVARACARRRGSALGRGGSLCVHAQRRADCHPQVPHARALGLVLDFADLLRRAATHRAPRADTPAQTRPCTGLGCAQSPSRSTAGPAGAVTPRCR